LKPFADRLAQAVADRKTPAMVGLDPRWESLPEALRGAGNPADLQAKAAAYEQFCRAVIDVVAPLVPIVKPQAAFFERLGPPGTAALGNVVRYARKRDLLVLLDGKRNDIGSTAIAYAEGYLGEEPESPWAADALTVSPYLGEDSLSPFIDVASQRHAGIFVLVKTSNPGGGMLQDLEADGKPIFVHVAELVQRLSLQSVAACGYGPVGAVVGATYPEQLARLRTEMPNAWLLVPGFGAQGGAAADVAGAFDERGLGAVVNNSRGILFAYAREPYAGRFGQSAWQEAIEAATRDMIDQLADQTPAGRLR
jgi:orotidine-5'-phosphate decarboxylase